MHKFICFLIDDDEDDREVFQITLHQIGESIEYITAKNGLEAIEMLSKDDSFLPDFIFLDLNMPLMNGHECLEEIKKIPKLKHIPVIVYSTSAHENDVKRAEKQGAAHFLKKPNSIHKLKEVLIKLFALKKLEFKIKL